MRLSALTLISSLALAAVPAAAIAAPGAPSLPAQAPANLVQVSGGCGWAYHRDAWGYCEPNGYGYGYTGYGYYRPYYHWGYHPYWHWHH